MTVAGSVNYGTSRVGDNEYPPGSNRGWFWNHVSDHWGANYQGSPWCGGYCIDVALHGGLKLPVQMVSVWYVESWARARGRWGTNPAHIKKGDLVVLFDHGKHVEFAKSDGTSAGYRSLGGNTSSQDEWNGGTVADQWRSAHQVVGFARISDKYPKPPKFDPRRYPLKKVPVHYFGRKKNFAVKLRPRIHNGYANRTDRENVMRIQKWLEFLGYYNGKISGHYNLKTHAAVKKFQRARGWENPNGLVGPKVWLAIQKAVYNKRY